MELLVIDFETFYGADYTLTKMTTDAYILDPRFKVHGAAVWAKGRMPEPVWVSGFQLPEFFAGVDWANTAVMAHNAPFDGFILTQHYGVKPAFWFDTLAMARAAIGVEVGGSLKKVAEYYGLGVKGDELVLTRDVRTLDSWTEQRLAGYACNDAKLCYEAFVAMRSQFSNTELRLIDLTTRMFVDPVVELDADLLRQHLQEIRGEKQRLLSECGMDTREELMKNDRLAYLLDLFGVSVPMKKSPTTGKSVYAFAKSDKAFTSLLEHEHETVRALVEARLAVKSTIDETRAQRFLDVAQTGRPWPVMLNYAGAATTLRWSGGNKQNPQNMRRGGTLRKTIKAPAGWQIVVCDSSQIEARTLALVAGQADLLQVFADKGDPYSYMASDIYGRPIDKKRDPTERQVGKVAVLGCFAADTKVLTQRGFVRIADVFAGDVVWDGLEWVQHGGLVAQGVKQTVRVYGLAATSDHAILTQYGWQQWGEVCRSEDAMRSALGQTMGYGPHILLPTRYELTEYQPTYDIAFAGPRNRYMVLTDAGPLLVHNCGYGIGAPKFKDFARLAGVTLTDTEAQQVVAKYRAKNSNIQKLWWRMNDDIAHMEAGRQVVYPHYSIEKHAMMLPSGLRLKYPGLINTADGWAYLQRGKLTRVYGAKLVENLIQALARIVVAEQMLAIEQFIRPFGGRVWLMAHDEVCTVVPDEHAQGTLQFMLEAMHTPPKWAPDLPVAAEAGRAQRYGDAK